MVQLIAVYVIVGFALFYTGYSVVKTLATKSEGACGDDCGCTAKYEIHKALKNAKRV